MSVTFKIEVTDPAVQENIHRFRNLGEDIWRELKNVSSLTLDEVDCSTSVLFVRDVLQRDVSVVLPTITRLLSRHNYSNSVSVVRLKKANDEHR